MSGERRMRIVTSDDVAGAVGLADLVEPVARALAAYSRGQVRTAPMMLFDLPDGEVHVKAAVLDGAPSWSVKVSASVPGNAGRALPAAHSTVTLFDATTGRPEVLIQDDGGLLSGLRTAAAGAVAARLLALPTETLLVIGTGLQARLQPQAFALQRPFSRLLVWGRRKVAAARTAEDLRVALPEVHALTVLERLDATGPARSAPASTTGRPS